MVAFKDNNEVADILFHSQQAWRLKMAPYGAEFQGIPTHMQRERAEKLLRGLGIETFEWHFDPEQNQTRLALTKPLTQEQYTAFIRLFKQHEQHNQCDSNEPPHFPAARALRIEAERLLHSAHWAVEYGRAVTQLEGKPSSAMREAIAEVIGFNPKGEHYSMRSNWDEKFWINMPEAEFKRRIAPFTQGHCHTP